MYVVRRGLRTPLALKLTYRMHRLLFQRQNNKALLQAKSKFLLLHSPTHHVHSLAQILSSPEVRRELSNRPVNRVRTRHADPGFYFATIPSRSQVSSQLKDTKFAQEGVMLEKCVHCHSVAATNQS